MPRIRFRNDNGNFSDVSETIENSIPTVDVEETSTGHKVSITDINGDHEFEVKNGKDGSDGYSPVRGVDYWTNEDKEAIVSRVLLSSISKNQGSENVGKILVVGTDGNLTLTDMPEGGTISGDITGVLDDNNNLLISGNLSEGTYTLKYVFEDGSITDAGSMTVATISAFSIITTLKNCTASGATSIRTNGSSTVTITASEGYTLPTTITVSGADYTWNSSTGAIVLSNPTSDVYITVTAEKERTNFFDASTGFYGRLSSAGENRTDAPSNYVTNYIGELQAGDIIEITGCTIGHLVNGSAPYLSSYNSSKANLYTGRASATESNSYWSIDNLTSTYAQITILSADVKYFRMSIANSANYGKTLTSELPTIDLSTVVINIKRNGEWL